MGRHLPQTQGGEEKEEKSVMIRLLFILLLAFLCPASFVQAHACSCAGTTEESSNKVLEEAFFIGRMSVRETGPAAEGSLHSVTLDSIEPYTKTFYGTLSAVYIPAAKSCGTGLLKAGEEAELIIYEDPKYNFRVAGRCTSLLPAHWEKLRRESAEKQGKMDKDKAACIAQDGDWSTHGLFVTPFCILSSADAGKPCRDSNECEGACIAELTEEEERLLIKEYGQHVLDKTGKCSAQQSVFGCHPYVTDGKVHHIMCVD